MDRIPHKMLIFGVFFIFFGAGLLLINTGLFPRLFDLWPVALVIFGLMLLYFVFARGAYKVYMFPGFVFTLSGILILVMQAVSPYIVIEKVWPLFMLIIGLSMLPYLTTLKGNRKIVLAVPAVTIIILSIVFGLFSLDIITMSFTHFAAIWWPVLFVILGAVLIVEEIRRKE